VLVRRSEKWQRLSATALPSPDKKTGKKVRAKKASKPSRHAAEVGAQRATSKSKAKAKAKAKAQPKTITSAQAGEHIAATEASTVPVRNLLQYTRIHEEIGQIQNAVAQAQGCTVWSMLQAMGGQGGAYRWARQSPPLMARDLIHFTVPGYQQLARQFANDMDWNAAQLGLVTPP